MNGRCSISAVLLVVAAAASVANAARPPRITHLADATRLSERDRSDIRLHAEYWCDRLSASNPEEVDEARGKLVEPLRAVRVGDVFRLEYTRAALPLLERVLEGGNPQAAVNAMQVIALLGTPKALQTIVDNSGIGDQTDLAIRLWAAKSLPLAVRQGSLPENEINRALRHFGHVAADETEWLVLRRQFEAIASVRNQVSRDEQINVLRAIAGRMAEVQPGPSDLMRAAYPALKLMRDEYLDLELRDPDQLESFGKALAPALCDVCTVANQHWDMAQSDAAARVNYGGAVQISENLLKLIDSRVRPRQAGPRTELGPAWRNRDEQRFDADHNKWQAVLRNPPYKK